MDYSKNLRHKVLRELTTEWQKERSPVVFEKILRRVDSLVLSSLHMVCNICPHLLKEDMQELYHTAIVGLGRGLVSVKEKDDGGAICNRIISYIRAELEKEYPYRKCMISKRASEALAEKRRESTGKESEAEIFVESFLLEDTYKRLVRRKVITKQDLLMLKRRFVEGRTYPELGKMFGCSHTGIMYKIREVIEKIHMNAKID